jgi:hypothetical protein
LRTRGRRHQGDAETYGSERSKAAEKALAARMRFIGNAVFHHSSFYAT